MRSFIIPAAIAVALASSSMALAASTAHGTIKAFDLKAMTLTLDNGTVYNLPAGFKDPGFKIGEKVAVYWDMNNGKYAASKVEITK